MSGRGVFLTAEWRNLVMFNYSVSPELLIPYVPTGTDIDLFGGRAYMSLVAFEFNRTRVFGLAIPFHYSFEEVNLRFYVRRGERRGVVFIRELVPRFAIAAVARIFFGENYSSVPMKHGIESRADAVAAEFSWGREQGACAMHAKAEGSAIIPADGSLSQFITEHYWGYAKQRDGSSLEYEVEHPRWAVRAANEARFSGNAAVYYGEQLTSAMVGPPDSAFIAEGSVVKVFRGAPIGR